VKCRLCGKHTKKHICGGCVRRINTWGECGYSEMRSLLSFSEIEVEEVYRFCEKYYIGRSRVENEKRSIFKVSMRILGWKGKIVGRHKKYNDYLHVRNANIGKHNREGTKKTFCEICKAKNDLRLHHVVPASWGGAFFFPDLVVTLCEKCHREIHAKLTKRLTRELKIGYFSPHMDEIKRLACSMFDFQI